MRYVVGNVSFDQLLAYVFGFFFCVVLLTFAAIVPEPSSFAVFVVRVILSLAAAGIGAVLPGLLHVHFPGIRAGGALALAAIVYFANPPTIFRDTIEKKVGALLYQIDGQVSQGNIELATENLNKAQVLEPEPADIPFFMAA